MSVKRKPARWAAAVAMALVMASQITACYATYVDRQPISLSLNTEGQLLVAVCKTLEIAELRVSERNIRSDNRDWAIIWHVTGSAIVQSGTILKFGQPISGLGDGEALAPNPTDGAVYHFAIIQNDGDSVVATFPALSADSLSVGEWFYTDGESELEPCDLDKRV